MTRAIYRLPDGTLSLGHLPLRLDGQAVIVGYVEASGRYVPASGIDVPADTRAIARVLAPTKEPPVDALAALAA